MSRVQLLRTRRIQIVAGRHWERFAKTSTFIVWFRFHLSIANFERRSQKSSASCRFSDDSCFFNDSSEERLFSFLHFRGGQTCKTRVWNLLSSSESLIRHLSDLFDHYTSSSRIAVAEKVIWDKAVVETNLFPSRARRRRSMMMRKIRR